MRKILAAGMAALTFGGAVTAAALPATAQARDWHDGDRHEYRGRDFHGHGDWDRHRGDGGAAIAAGIAGLAIGAALSDGGPRYYSYGYPAYSYDDDDAPYAVCETQRWVWDPYIGRHVLVRRHYPC